MFEYNKQITSAFRNDAIKSVILIDDDYVPYEDIVRESFSINEKIDTYIDSLDSEEATKEKYKETLQNLKLSLKQSTLATEVKEYFNKLSIVCDVEKTTKDISAEKIRKSDLIVLDYQLDNDDPTQALKLIHELSENSHMNIVVVYTNNDLDKTWLEIAACLRGSTNSEDYSSADNWEDRWDEFEEEYEPENWLPSSEAVAEFLKSGNGNNIRKEVARIINGKKFPDSDLWLCYLETVVGKLNILQEQSRTDNNLIQGNFLNKECQWLISGNVFVTLLSKNQEDQGLIPKAEQIWSQVEKALCDWAPSLYRVVASELQNKIEDGRFSFEAGLPTDHKREAALLWHLINNPTDNLDLASGNLLEHMLQDFSHDLLKEETLVKFIKNIALNVAKDAKPFTKATDDNGEEYKQYIESLFKVAYDNTNRGKEKLDDKYYGAVIHTLNEELSTYKILPQFITTGLVLVDADNPQDWYLCVTPSCNSVPGQASDLATKKMKPHRNHTLLKLEKFTNYHAQLKNATQSKFIFVTHGSQKLVLSVLDSNTHLPKIEKVVVMNHDNEMLTPKGKSVAFLSVEGSELKYIDKTLKPVTQLRPAYAARFQNVQSHYEGRIGVDYVDLNI